MTEINNNQSKATKQSKTNKQAQSQEKPSKTEALQSTTEDTDTDNSAKPVFSLSAKQLKKCTNPDSLPKSTKQAGELDVTFGQDRAMKAIKTGLGIKASGYHIFASGENGMGKRTLITRLLSEYVKTMPTPEDWVYVYNFADPREPIAMQLPAGEAFKLAKAVEQLWTKSFKTLGKRFRSDRYQSQVEAIKNNIHAKETQAYEELSEEGKQYNLELHFRSSDNKVMFVESDNADNGNSNEDNETDDNKDEKESVSLNVNVDDASAQEDKPQDKADTEQASESNQSNERDENNENNENNEDNEDNESNSEQNTQEQSSHKQKNHMLKRFNQLTVALEKLEDEANSAIEHLHKDIAKRALDTFFNPVFKQYATQKNVLQYLKSVYQDMIQHVERIVNQDDEEFMVSNLAKVPIRYCVNIMASHEPDSGAPIVFEDLPTHLNLLGHVEQVTHLGSVTTDVSMIRSGSLHKANGGFLLLEANSLLEHPYAWQGLKRALQSRQIKLSSLEQMLTLTGSLSLAPTPIDLDVKVVLLGEPDLYYELVHFEPEFDAVFKIRADFHDDVKRTKHSELAMVAKIADIVKAKGLLTFNNKALARIIDHLSLLADDQNLISLHSDRLKQVLYESERHAKLANRKTVTDVHVNRTIKDMSERSGYLRDLYWQEIENGRQIINTSGESIGEINALTVISYADSEFGLPARLTALIQPKIGSGHILDIERNVNLGGDLHAKGMLIMSSYLRSLFSDSYPLNFDASLAFEQNYGHIDGDSATLAEACALVSALAQVPIKQSIAITGSMNQFGQVQAIGGLNAKITGFYDTCVEQGLTGTQGVIIPKDNIHNLMLRDDIIEAVEKGKFSIYAITHLHEALAVLTGMIVDEKNKKGKYRKKSIFGKIARRLKEWA